MKKAINFYSKYTGRLITCIAGDNLTLNIYQYSYEVYDEEKEMTIYKIDKENVIQESIITDTAIKREDLIILNRQLCSAIEEDATF